MELLDERRLRELVYGGAVLGAGGGGSIEAGMAAGSEALALGSPRLVEIDELAPTTLIATLSIVGSMGGMSGCSASSPTRICVTSTREVGEETHRRRHRQ